MARPYQFDADFDFFVHSKQNTHETLLKNKKSKKKRKPSGDIVITLQKDYGHVISAFLRFLLLCQ